MVAKQSLRALHVRGVGVESDRKRDDDEDEMTSSCNAPEEASE